MSGLQRFEQRLEQAISGVFARAFRSAVQPVEISAALQRELDNNAQILSRDRRLVPNSFHVELSQTDLDRLSPYDNALEREFSEQIHAYAQKQGYSFPGDVTIAFGPQADLTTGRFRVRSEAHATVTPGPIQRTRSRRPRAVLEINGTPHPLSPPGLVIGRGSEADLRINDPGISRRHAEFLVHAQGPDGIPEIEVHDMGSTNGIAIDGRKSPRARLHDGSTVRVGRTTVTVRILADDADGAADV